MVLQLSIAASAFDIAALTGEDNENSNLSSLQAIRLVRAFRLVKLIRLMRASRMLKRWESRVSINYGAINLAKSAITVLVLAHWFACVWGCARTPEPICPASAAPRSRTAGQCVPRATSSALASPACPRGRPCSVHAVITSPHASHVPACAPARARTRTLLHPRRAWLASCRLQTGFRTPDLTWRGKYGYCLLVDDPLVAEYPQTYTTASTVYAGWACTGEWPTYMAALYWAVMTITSIGYGDITANHRSPSEQVGGEGVMRRHEPRARACVFCLREPRAHARDALARATLSALIGRSGACQTDLRGLLARPRAWRRPRRPYSRSHAPHIHTRCAGRVVCDGRRSR